MRLAVHGWGDADGPLLVCLHGVTGHGRHFARLGARLARAGRRVVAPDLLGHGNSPWEPPWSIAAHLDALVASVGDEPAAWLGHSFGARLAHELAAARPELVRRLVLLDPALLLPAHVALWAAESGRADRSYASFAEAIERRYEESQLHGAPRALLQEELRAHLALGEDGRWRYRYCQSAVVTAYSEMASAPPPFARVRVPTLLVLGAHSYLSYEHLLDDHRAALGDLLRVVTVDGGHTVLWDALDETAEAVAAFLADERVAPRV
ncbi:MAG TPA: alpha/beta fold hydrolase [Gaiellaceae bacterium]|nr:alpha/beta fold hydrolase [Gaiellaceae bacterium]